MFFLGQQHARFTCDRLLKKAQGGEGGAKGPSRDIIGMLRYSVVTIKNIYKTTLARQISVYERSNNLYLKVDFFTYVNGREFNFRLRKKLNCTFNIFSQTQAGHTFSLFYFTRVKPVKFTPDNAGRNQGLWKSSFNFRLNKKCLGEIVGIVRLFRVKAKIKIEDSN